MPTSPADDDRPDSDPTDELPILLETAGLGPDEHEGPRTVVGNEDTGEYTAHHPTLFADHELERRRSDPAPRDARLETLEAEVTSLRTRFADAEALLAEKDASIERLRSAISAADKTIVEAVERAGRLTRDAAEQAAEIAALRAELERERGASGRDLETERREEDVLPEPTAKRTEPDSQNAVESSEKDAQTLREEMTVLAGYIENRNAAWNELEARASAAKSRNVELERELAQRMRREQEAVLALERQDARVVALRSRLLDRERQAEELRDRLDAAWAAVGSPDARTAKLESQISEAAARAARLEAELKAALRDRDIERASAEQHRAEQAEALALAEAKAADALRSLTGGAVIVQPQPSSGVTSTEPEQDLTFLAELEHELETTRAQLRLMRHTSNDLGARLEAVDAELAENRRQLALAGVEAERLRADNLRLERSLLDKDRALEAREERIATLQKEIEQRSQAQPADAPLASSDPERGRKHPVDYAGGNPLLICLTSDTPHRYPLTKRTTLIGRSSQCDIQILTHFVSREHARVIIGRGTVTIEDLGSTNGVFVNSVRIERHELRHSDIVTVGETQFRFLETVAH